MVSEVDEKYAQLVRKVLEQGVEKDDRTGVGTLSLFGERIELDISKQFPLLTTKYVPFKHVFIELQWFLRGRIDVKWLNDRGVTIWDEWKWRDGTIGRGYGKQWRHEANDQIAQLQQSLVADPNSRRHIVSAWNAGEISQMALPPCHMMFQCYVANNTLSMQMVMRSVDCGLGLPFNIASYAALLHLLAKSCCLDVGKLVIVFGDTHIYKNHIDQLKGQIERDPKEPPTFTVKRFRRNVWEYELDDVELTNYTHHPKIKMEVAV